MVSYYFRFSSEKQRKLAKNLRRGFRNHNLHVQGNNLRNFFLKKAIFLIDFVISAKFFPLWAKENRQGLSKLHSACPEEKCEDFSLKQGWFYISFCTLSKNIVDFCQTVTAGFPKLQSTCPEKTFGRKKLKKEDFLVILYFEWKNLELGRTNFGRVCQKCILRVQGRS